MNCKSNKLSIYRLKNGKFVKGKELACGLLKWEHVDGKMGMAKKGDYKLIGVSSCLNITC